eukprot:6182144-Pleurochrysis_carterae.AAC.1
MSMRGCAQHFNFGRCASAIRTSSKHAHCALGVKALAVYMHYATEHRTNPNKCSAPVGLLLHNALISRPKY